MSRSLKIRRNLVVLYICLVTSAGLTYLATDFNVYARHLMALSETMIPKDIADGGDMLGASESHRGGSNQNLILDPEAPSDDQQENQQNKMAAEEVGDSDVEEMSLTSEYQRTCASYSLNDLESGLVDPDPENRDLLPGNQWDLDQLPPGFILSPKKVKDRLQKGTLEVPCQNYLKDLYVHFHVVHDVTNVTHGNAFGGDQVTFVTQLTAKRMDKLEMILDYWSGPVSAALFVNTTEAKEVLQAICSGPVFQRRWRHLAIHFVMRHHQEEMYPINHLRNVALESARSTYVFLSDVDFAPHPHSHQIIRRHCADMRDSMQAKTALIVPAFEFLRDLSLPEHRLPRTKTELLSMQTRGHLQAFHIQVFPRGHGPTNFDVWNTATQPYKITWSQYFEPYVVLRREMAPLYPRELLSRQLNKVAHILLLQRMGFEFRVLPDVFTIHVPHPSDRQVRLWYSCVMNLYGFMVQETSRKKVKLRHLKDIVTSVMS